MATSTDQIARAVKRFRDQVPALAKLKLVFGLELTTQSLTGEPAPERFRVELPGPKVSEGAGDDERIVISLPATMFRVLAEEGQLADWQEALHYRHLQIEGDPRVQRLLGQAIEPALAASEPGASGRE
jgi:hypothetical protein